MVLDVNFNTRGNTIGFGGQGGGEGGGGTPPGWQAPAAPRNVSVTVLRVGVTPSFRVSWTDEEVQPPATRTVDNWQVRFVDEKVAGTTSNEPDFPTKALGLSRFLNTISSQGQGAVLTYTHTEEGMKDGYVLVIGVKDFYGGPPSQPWLVRLQSSSLVIADEVTDQDAVLFTETFNGAEYFNFTPEFTSPSDVTVFKGVQIYWDPYPSDLAEMGNVDVFVGQTGGFHQVSPYRRFPVDDSLAMGRGTLTSTNGDVEVVWDSGDVFDVGWVGRPIFIQWTGGTDDFAGAWITRSVNAFTDATHLDLDTAAPEDGVFPFFVMAPITAYFVSISIYGTRRTDVTSAPSVSL
jgi:hypothetical protein